MINISRLTDRESMLGIIASDADIKKTSDFAFIDHFDFLCQFRDDQIAEWNGETADEDIIDIDIHDDISTDIDAWIDFESLKSHIYNDLW